MRTKRVTQKYSYSIPVIGRYYGHVNVIFKYLRIPNTAMAPSVVRTRCRVGREYIRIAKCFSWELKLFTMCGLDNAQPY